MVAQAISGVRRAICLAALAVTTCAAVAGCSEQPSVPSPSPSPTQFGGENAGSLTAGMSDKAAAIIASGRASGGLDRQDLDEAAANAMDCMQAGGLLPSFVPPSDPYSGFRVGWSFDVGDGPDSTKADQFDKVGNACADTEYYPVETEYLAQPSAIEAHDTALEEQKSLAINCLRTTKYSQGEDATWQEVSTALTEDFFDRRERSCYTSLGISG